MRARQIERWSTQHILPQLPGFVARGAHLFATPVGLIHKVITFEHHDPITLPRIQLGVMPLWTPTSYVHFGYSIDLIEREDALGPIRPDNAHNVFARIARYILKHAPAVFDRLATPRQFLGVRDVLSDWYFEASGERVPAQHCTSAPPPSGPLRRRHPRGRPRHRPRTRRAVHPPILER